MNSHSIPVSSHSTPISSSHTDFQSLPIVDISGLYASDAASRHAAAHLLGTAAREAGFLYVTGHGIDAALFRELRSIAQGYFAQDFDAKRRHYIGQSSNHSGYVPMGEEYLASGSYDYKETFDLSYDYTGASGRKPMLGPNQWPDFPQFQTVVSRYYQAAFAVGQALFRGFAMALGLAEDYFAAMVTTPPSQLRLIHYPYNPAIEDRPGIGAHTDYECFTILYPTADGLEVMNGAGEWIDAPVIPGTLVVNIGDMMEILSNGQFVATSHRVRKVKEERYSFPLFCACDYDTLITPIPDLPAGRRTYTPLRCGDHLYAQTIQTFSYLKDRLARGEISLPEHALALSSFGPKTDREEG